MGCTSSNSLLEDFSDDPANNQKKSLETILLKNHGLFDIQIKVNIRDTEGLSLAYTPGVATPCLQIQKDLSKAYEQTNKGNSILVLTDSSKFAGDKKCNYSHIFLIFYFLKNNYIINIVRSFRYFTSLGPKIIFIINPHNSTNTHYHFLYFFLISKFWSFFPYFIYIKFL